MIGSLLSLVGYWAVLGILQLWAAIKVVRGNPLLGVAMFLFWPLSLFALVRYWGDEDLDVRTPVLLSLLTLGLIVFMANRVVDKGMDEIALAVGPEDIAMIREQDPTLAMEIEARRAVLIEQGVLEPDAPFELLADAELAGRLRASGHVVDGLDEREEDDFAGEPETVPVHRDPVEVARERRFHLEQAAAAVSYRFGSIPLGESGLQLDLPDSFRFVHRDALVRLAKLRDEPLDDSVLGWMVHRRADLARDDAWFVEVGTTRLARPFPALAADGSVPLADVLQELQLADAEAVRRGPMAPSWDGARRIARWSERDASAGAPARYLAVLPGRGQALRLAMRGVDAPREELAERALRLLATRVVPASAP